MLALSPQCIKCIRLESEDHWWLSWLGEQIVFRIPTSPYFFPMIFFCVCIEFNFSHFGAAHLCTIKAFLLNLEVMSNNYPWQWWENLNVTVICWSTDTLMRSHTTTSWVSLWIFSVYFWHQKVTYNASCWLQSLTWKNSVWYNLQGKGQR